MARKDRKTAKLRGSRMHGYGNAQKHRGAGSRGGRGMAGSKKQRWHRVSKDHKNYFGKKGFKRPSSVIERHTTVNVGYLSQNIDKLVEKGLAKKGKGAYAVDLGECLWDKLLGAGKVVNKLNVKVEHCSDKARKKIEEKGGSVESKDSAEEFAEQEFEEVTESGV